MRWCMLLVLLVPLATGQAIFEDPEGDQEAGYYLGHWEDEPVAWMPTDGQGWYRYADLVRVGILEETETDLVFVLEMAALEPAGEPSEHDYIQVAMPFTLRGQQMQASFRYWMDPGAGFLTVGTVEKIPFGSGTLTRITNAVGAPLEMTDDGLVGRVAKEGIRDRNLVPLRAGDVLEGITVAVEPLHSSRSSPCLVGNTPNCWRARDVVEGTLDLTIEKNPPGVGHLLIQSDAPWRGSNGAATTYLFNVTVRNLDDVDDRLTVQVGGQPSDWVVHAPTTVPLPGGKHATIPIAVSVPFRHAHGDEATMQVRVASTQVPGIEAEQELGVIWHEVPQPGGHHDTLFLHAREGRGWMNALAGDPEAQADGAIEWNSRSSSGNHHRLGYTIRLLPHLLMGLDFVPGQDVELELPIQSGAATDARLSVAVRVTGERGGVLSRGEWDVSLQEGTNRQTLKMPLEQGIDRIPYAAAANLHLEVGLEYNATPAGPGVLPFSASQPDHAILTDGAWLRLPLQEFHDVIDEDLLSSLTRLSLRPDGEPDRLVNPGRTAAVRFVVANAGDRASTVDWHLEGTNVEWAKLTPAATTVAAKRNASVLVAVMPPESAKDADVAQLLLIGTLRSDPDVQVFGRLLVTATTTQQIPDEAHEADALADEARASQARPAPAGLVVLVGMVAAVGLRRARH